MSGVRTHVNNTNHPTGPSHIGSVVSQSKSHVLAGVQDAYWSDDEAEDVECPLCLEEMDISDLNFKPCICGYQICRFCWHHIKENLNKKCPACRRIYTDEAVEFKQIPSQDHKRLTQQRKQRERERKELDILGRRHLVNVRVVQRNVVFILGIGPRFAKEEFIPTLRSCDYFGQYGKIIKIILVKRTLSVDGNAGLGLYITYQRKEDAARCISYVDGAVSPSGGREVMQASYGTTKYCMTFLRGTSCNDHSCMNLHEWGDENDCFTKEDLTTLKHTMKTTENRSRNSSSIVKRGQGSDGNLPRGTFSVADSHSTSNNNTALSIFVPPRQPRRGTGIRQHRASNTISSHNESRPTRNAVGQTTFSRPSTPTMSTNPEQGSGPRLHGSKKQVTRVVLLRSPPISSAPDSDPESGLQTTQTMARKESTSTQFSQPSLADSSLPAGLPVKILDLSAPPGLSLVNCPPRAETTSPQTPLLASPTPYQMSIAARALFDDLKARRESEPQTNDAHGPFRDFDRTLQMLSGIKSGGFSFNLDLKLTENDGENTFMPVFEDDISSPLPNSYIDHFPDLQRSPGSCFLPSLGLAYSQSLNRLGFDSITARFPPVSTGDGDVVGVPGYLGCFDPFAESNDESIQSFDFHSRRLRPLTSDDECSPNVSRFGFARRQGSANSSIVTSPWPGSRNFDSLLNDANDKLIQKSSNRVLVDPDQVRRTSTANSLHSVSSSCCPTISGKSQVFESSITEAQLRNFIQSSKDRAFPTVAIDGQISFPFKDPAIFSAPSLVPALQYGPPPGLQFPLIGTTATNSRSPNTLENSVRAPVRAMRASAPSSIFSLSDFPALISNASGFNAGRSTFSETNPGSKLRERVEKKNPKKAASVESLTDKPRLTPEISTLNTTEPIQRGKLENEWGDSTKTPDHPKVGATVAVKIKRSGKEKSLQPSQSDSRENEGEILKKNQTLQNEADCLTRVSKPPRPNHVTEHSFPASDPVHQDPILSKKPKKYKPLVKPIIKFHKGIAISNETSTIPHLAYPSLPIQTDLCSNDSRSISSIPSVPTSLDELLEEINVCNPELDLCNHPFFDCHRLNSATMPLEYGPLVHALSALSVGGGSFSNNMPSGSIDNAVSSFQQLLETLTQTISDLLRLLPRTTWDDSSSFDGVLRDMLRGDDFLDDAGEECRDKGDEVQALTLALERRAKWMEVQLSKLEELHRDINTAAVRAVLSFNDNGWDRHSSLPRTGNSLRRFDNVGVIEEEGVYRPMTSLELEDKLAVAREAAMFAESQVREVMQQYNAIVRPECGCESFFLQ